jgi:hypothetical protein
VTGRGARRVLLGRTGAFDEEDERLGAAVHRRQLRAADIDDRVVDPGHRQRRHDMLDANDPGAIAVGENERVLGDQEVLGPGADAGRSRPVAAAEADTRAGRRRLQGEANAGPRMAADADAADGVAERALRGATLGSVPGLTRAVAGRRAVIPV